MAGKKRNHNGREQFAAADWLLAARKALVKHGILAVKVDRLARSLRVTRGSFYWHFKSQKDLLDQLLNAWVSTNTAPFERVLDLPTNAQGKFRAIVDLWLAETEYDPKFDTAVREWARISSHVERVVRQCDEARIAVFENIFQGLGYTGADALVRARITYFHQVGYYALGIVESHERRRRLTPYYTRALLGTKAPPRRTRAR